MTKVPVEAVLNQFDRFFPPNGIRAVWFTGWLLDVAGVSSDFRSSEPGFVPGKTTFLRGLCVEEAAYFESTTAAPLPLFWVALSGLGVFTLPRMLFFKAVDCLSAMLRGKTGKRDNFHFPESNQINQSINHSILCWSNTFSSPFGRWLVLIAGKMVLREFPR